MTARTGRAGLALALLLAAAVAPGCAPREEKSPATGGDSTGTSAATTAPRDPDDERPAALLGPPVGRGDSLLAAIRMHLVEWVEFWRAAEPKFLLDSLRAGGAAPFRPPADAQPWPVPGVNSDVEGSMSSPALVMESPGGRYALLVDRYLAISDEARGIEIGGEPDSAPVLFDRGTGVSRTFEFCGTPCAFHWGTWIDSTTFALGGWADARPEGWAHFGTLGIYDLRRALRTTYYAPARDSAASERYRAAWREWLVARHRATNIAAFLPR